MRTTLLVDDDVLQAARSLAKAESRTIGEVISELARRGLQARRTLRSRGPVPTFEVSASSPPITAEMVRQAHEDES